MSTELGSYLFGIYGSQKQVDRVQTCLGKNSAVSTTKPETIGKLLANQKPEVGSRVVVIGGAATDHDSVDKSIRKSLPKAKILHVVIPTATATGESIVHATDPSECSLKGVNQLYKGTLEESDEDVAARQKAERKAAREIERTGVARTKVDTSPKLESEEETLVRLLDSLDRIFRSSENRAPLSRKELNRIRREAEAAKSSGHPIWLVILTFGLINLKKP